MPKPLLSIGIIFRDDIRCIERCLKALQPLRDAVPCELVMADTGSADGSRQIAERYADILFDFPWVDDFSAARNAVMDRASGEWFLTVDTDEYLDEDVSELVGFLRQTHGKERFAVVVVRNYRSYEMDESYRDFMAVRVLDMSTNVRYEGEIHEHWPIGSTGSGWNGSILVHTILHHDGYVAQDSKQWAEKCQRNLPLLRKRLEREPENLTVWLQLIESGLREPDIWDIFHQAAKLIDEKKSSHTRSGPPILRYAVCLAHEQEREDADEWIQRALQGFPSSAFTRIDVQYIAFGRHFDSGDLAGSIEHGECYLRAMEDYRAGKAAPELLASSLQFAGSAWERRLKVSLSEVYSSQEQFDRALELLAGLDFKALDTAQTAKVLGALLNIQFKSVLDTAPVIAAFWKGITSPVTPRRKAAERRRVFIGTAEGVFAGQNRITEAQAEGFRRHGYTLFLPLEDLCGAGQGALMLETDDPQALEALLGNVENWEELPIHALAHALDCGAQFPLPDKPLNLEEMDSLATRLAQDQEYFLPLAVRILGQADFEDWPKTVWARGVAMAAVRAYPWGDKEQDEELGMALARSFAKAERKFLPLCYTREVLREEWLFALPPMHRFGWYCAQAFDALEQGKPAEYVRLLREGLDACEGMKPMVEFLADHTREVQQMLTPPELRALADQVRVILARFDSNDPMVAALKQSEAYQKVAHLIEGMPAPVWGGQTQ